MKALGILSVSFVGLTLTAAAGRGDGGPPTAPPSNTGGGTTGGSTPGASDAEWKARVLAAYADGSLSPSERREIKRFLRSLPVQSRFRYSLSWARLRSQMAGNKNSAVVTGLVATWASSDPGAAAGWLSGVSRDLEGFTGEVHQAYRTGGGLYYMTDQAMESLPPKWTTGVNIVWEDGTVSRSELARLLMIARSLTPAQRTVAMRHWLMLRKSGG